MRLPALHVSLSPHARPHTCEAVIDLDFRRLLRETPESRILPDGLEAVIIYFLRLGPGVRLGGLLGGSHGAGPAPAALGTRESDKERPQELPFLLYTMPIMDCEFFFFFGSLFWPLAALFQAGETRHAVAPRCESNRTSGTSELGRMGHAHFLAHGQRTGCRKRHQLQFISKKSKGMCRQGVQFHWYRLWRVQTVCQTRVSESCADSC